jgi:PAS domain S-box-containing protein
MLQKSLALRLAAYVACAAVALALVASAALIFLDYRSLDAQLKTALPQQLAALRSAGAQAAYQVDPSLAATVAEGALQNPGVVRAVVLDDYGATLADTGLPLPDRRSRTISDALFGPRFGLAIPLTHPAVGDRDIGSLIVTIDPLEASESFIDRSILLTAYGFFVVSIISLILYVITHVVMTRPLARLAAQLSPADLRDRGTSRLPELEWDGRDELGRLVEAVNTLFQVIENAIADLRVRDRALGAITQGIVIGDATKPNHPTVYVNDAFLRITGCTRDEALGRDCGMLLAEEADPAVIEKMRQAMGHGATFEDELLNHRKDGTSLWNHLSISPVQDEAGRTVHFVAVVVDMTERRSLEMQLRQAQKMEAVGQLTGGIAHDFNNLLTVVLGNAEHLAERLKDDAALRRMVEIIQEMALRGADLTQRLLAFARRQTLQPRPIDVGALVSEVEPLLHRTLGEAITVETTTAADLWLALVDGTQLQTVLINLAINARDAMPQGGRLNISAANLAVGDGAVLGGDGDAIAAGDYVAITVTDSGQGMAPEVLQRAVEPFFTTKDVGKGSGLGLSMVYGFVKQSGGQLRIFSEPGRGTTVTLLVPRATGAAAEGPRMPAGTDLPAGRGETILVVEDDGDVRSHVDGLLRGLGYRVMTARSGAEALAVLEGPTPVSLLFSDIIMPDGMDGIELAMTARRLRPRMGVLLTSGYPEAALQGRRLDGPLPALLMKPYQRTELARKLRAALDSREDSRETLAAPQA